MIYREFRDIRLSPLGIGAVRLSVLDGDGAGIDEAQTFRAMATVAAAAVYSDAGGSVPLCIC